MARARAEARNEGEEPEEEPQKTQIVVGAEGLDGGGGDMIDGRWLMG